jgi:predicted esterase
MPRCFNTPHPKCLSFCLVVAVIYWTSIKDPTQLEAQEPDCVTWDRVLPPKGISIPSDKQQEWAARIGKLESKLEGLTKEANWADVAILVKACKLAIQFSEFYQEKDFPKCDRLLKLAEQRVEQLGVDAAWIRDSGLQVRGFQSKVDGSVQPVGLIIPEKLDANAKVPLYVWLHGRGDKATDLHFICERLDKKGEVAPNGAITLHPFGRHCVGYKSAGSTDVMEAIDFACANYPIDQRRIVLIGFSMGGAGVWHLAAHYTDRFVAASPGAGFAETARYQNLKPENYPPKFEQILWSVNDVPGYTRNLFNLPVIAYSGEMDKQIQAARVMEEAYQAEGRTLEHLIGPGMGHKYHPDVLKDLLSRLGKIADEGKNEDPDTLSLQTRHLHFAKRQWIKIDGMEQQYEDTRVDAKRQSDGSWHLKTKNVSRLEVSLPTAAKITVDASILTVDDQRTSIKLQKNSDGFWKAVVAYPAIRKHPGISGPIDDVFYSPFLFVLPTGKSSNARVAKWVDCESSAAITRWTALMRGEPRVKKDIDVTDEDLKKFHLVLWGDAESNSLIARMMKQPTVPLQWNKNEIALGDTRWDAAKHIPVLIMPNPEANYRYIAFNSGLTFREAHDKTNSLQNPHLPDWAIISIDESRSAQRPGKIAAAGFFGDDWKLDPNLTFSL